MWTVMFYAKKGREKEAESYLNREGAKPFRSVRKAVKTGKRDLKKCDALESFDVITSKEYTNGNN